MTAKEQLLQAAMQNIQKRLDDAEMLKYDRYFAYKRAALMCRNTRRIIVRQMLPKTKGVQPYYTVQFLGDTGQNNHLSLKEAAEKTLEISSANTDISGSTPDDLLQMGFIPEENITLKQVSSLLERSPYQLILTNKRFYGPKYESGHEGQPYYGPTYCNIYAVENLCIGTFIAAHRNIKVGIKTVNAYIGD